MDTISQIKNKLDIVDVVSSYISLKKSGRNYKATCPFHAEDTPSFMVSPELQIYKCFGCGEAGDMFNFVQKMEGFEFIDVLETLAERAGVKIEKKQFDPNAEKKKKIYEINELTTKFFSHLLNKHKLGKSALDYLRKDRGLNPKTINDFRLGFAPNNWDSLYKFLSKKGYKSEELLLSGVVSPKRSEKGFIDKFRGRIVFPLINVDNKVLGFSGRDVVGRDPKYLNTKETLVFDKSNFLFGLDKAKVAIKKRGAVFVEGQMDVLSAFQHGIDNVVASSGTSLTGGQLRIISRYTKDLAMAFDSDTAGRAATARALELAGGNDFDVKVIIIPEKYADLDDYLQKNPKSASRKIKSPVPIYDFYLANALKSFNKDTAYGKKKIVAYLVPFFSKIKSKVVLDHYIKELTTEVSIGEDTLREAFSGKVVAESKIVENILDSEVKQKRIEDYLIALILKSPLDTMGPFLYKLKSQDFTNDNRIQIINKLKDYLDSNNDKFDIKLFIDNLEGEFKEFALEMYLWDFGVLTSEDEMFATELNATFLRVQKASIKRKLKKISEQIKLAELEKDAKTVKMLSKKFKTLSKKLL